MQIYHTAERATDSAADFEAAGLRPATVTGPDGAGECLTNCPCGAGMVRLGRPVEVTYPGLSYYACNAGHAWMYADRQWQAATSAHAARVEAMYRARYGDPDALVAESLPLGTGVAA